MITPRHGTHSLERLTPEVKTLLRLIPNVSFLTGVEVGALRGQTATLLLSRRPGLFLYCVDNFDCGDIVSYESPDVVRDALYSNVSRWSHCRVVELPSVIAAEGYGDLGYDSKPGWGDGDPFDFVYLDAKHDRRSVTADIAAWWPHVREGGMLCGHDYGREKPPAIEGAEWRVKDAADAFVADEGLQLRVEGLVWWVVKTDMRNAT